VRARTEVYLSLKERAGEGVMSRHASVCAWCERVSIVRVGGLVQEGGGGRRWDPHQRHPGGTNRRAAWLWNEDPAPAFESTKHD